MAFFDRLASAEGAIALVERLLKWGPLVIGVGGSGWLAGWATSATEAFASYSPLSWVLGVFCGAILFLFAYFLWAAARVRIASYRFAQDMAGRLHNVNPLEQTFNLQKIDINAFRNPYPEPVIGKTFINCELHGPAIVAFLGRTQILEAGIIECEFIAVRDDASLVNVIALQDTTIRGGKIYHLTVLVPKAHIASIPAGARWLT